MITFTKQERIECQEDMQGYFEYCLRKNGFTYTYRGFLTTKEIVETLQDSSLDYPGLSFDNDLTDEQKWYLFHVHQDEFTLSSFVKVVEDDKPNPKVLAAALIVMAAALIVTAMIVFYAVVAIFSV